MSDRPDKAKRHFDRELVDHRYRMRNDWHGLIEDLIADARNEGAFNDLPGAGKPLNLKKNPFAPEKELAHALLKNNDLVPAWIVERNYLLDQIKKLRAEIRRVWYRHERGYRMAREQRQRGSLIVGWDRALRKWSAQIRAGRGVGPGGSPPLAERVSLFGLFRARIGCLAQPASRYTYQIESDGSR